MLRALNATVLALCPIIALVAAAPAQPTEEERKAYDWFTALGLPDVKEAKFVHVATGRWTASGEGGPENHYMDGFLLEDRSDSFTVFTLSLAEENFEKTPVDTPAHERVAYKALDLKEDMVEYLNPRHRRAGAENPDLSWGQLFKRLRGRTEVFVLAWACSRKGLNGEAHDWFIHATRMPAQVQPRGRHSRLPLHESIAEDIAHSQMWQMILDFEQPKIPREELLERFRLFVRRFPRTQHIERAKETLALLEAMVQEDAEHAKRRKSAKPFDELDRKEQISELIFQLRNQNGHQWCQPGHCDIFFNWEGAEDTPAHRLVNIGYDAVPQLIDVLEDQRFTRSVGYHRNFYFSHFVLRVGDCAEEIISRIANQDFYRRTSTDGAMIKDGQAKAVRAKIESWYAELQK